MRLCVVVPCFFRGTDFCDAIKEISKLGYDAAETYSWQGIATPEVKKVLDENNVELLSMCTTEFRLTDPKYRGLFLDGLERSAEAAMFSFIDGIYVAISNSYEKEIEALEGLAVNTGMALAISRGNAINVLNLYNVLHDSAPISVDDALTNAEVMRVVSKTIADTIENMQQIGVAYSPFEWETFTPKDKLVVEVLAQYASAADVYLDADTFHRELVSLPNYEKIPYWQSQGKNKNAFADASKINIKNSALQVTDVYESDTVTQSGIIAFIHDIEAVACSFYDKRTWEMVNPRAEVLIHGDKAEKGYAVDGNANAIVLYMEDAGSITVSGDAGATLKYNHVYAGVQNTLTVTHGKTPTSTDVTLTQVGETDVYTFTPTSNADITITCS